MNNDFIAGMEILINCKRLVEDLIEERKYMLERAEYKGDDVQIRTLQKAIDRFQSVLDGKKYYGSYIRDREHIKEDF